MKINQKHILEKEPGDGWEYRSERTPNVGRTLEEPEVLIVHATGRASVENAESNYKKKGKGSVHLLLGKNEKEMVQLVTFNRRARHQQPERCAAARMARTATALPWGCGMEEILQGQS